MTLLLRKIDALDPWLNEGDLAAVAADPPIWAVREFMPSQKDGIDLSLHEVADESEAHRVAAAWAMLNTSPEKLRIAFAAVDRSAIEDIGLTITSSGGTHNHVFSDAQHRGLTIPSQTAVVAVASAFLRGDVIVIEPRLVMRALEAEIRSNGFQTVPIARAGTGNMAAKNLLKFIALQFCEVRGTAGLAA